MEKKIVSGVHPKVMEFTPLAEPSFASRSFKMCVN